LQNLYKNGRIHQFVSEPDIGEGHGFNKGVLLSKGILIKILTDDDFFNYSAIQECKVIMLENINIDVMIGNIYDVPIDNFTKIQCENMVENSFKSYLVSGKSFPFTGLSMMIRKSSIALTGLFHSKIVCMDTEFSLRITEIGVKIGWSNATIAIRIGNPQSKLSNMDLKNRFLEMDRTHYFYDENYRTRKNNLLISLLREIKSIIFSFIEILKNFKIKKLDKLEVDVEKNIYCNSDYVTIVNKKCEEFIAKQGKKTEIILPTL